MTRVLLPSHLQRLHCSLRLRQLSDLDALDILCLLARVLLLGAELGHLRLQALQPQVELGFLPQQSLHSFPITQRV